MLILCFAEHYDVIKVHQHKLAQHISQNIIHDRLKGSGCISQPKAQHSVLKQTKRRGERSLRHIFRLQSDLMVCTLQVYAGEDSGTLQLVKQVINAGQGVPILLGLLVERTVVNAHAHGAVLLCHKYDRATIFTAAFLNEPFFKQHCDLLFTFFHFISTQPVHFLVWR